MWRGDSLQPSKHLLLLPFDEGEGTPITSTPCVPFDDGEGTPTLLPFDRGEGTPSHNPFNVERILLYNNPFVVERILLYTPIDELHLSTNSKRYESEDL